MSSNKTLVSVAVGTAFVATLGAASVAFAAENPFALQSLDKGYMVADHHEAKPKAMKEGKCGAMKGMEGKCGMSMADTDKDGKITLEEFNTHHAAMFTKMDTNNDGAIDKTEMSKAMSVMKGMEGKCGGMK